MDVSLTKDSEKLLCAMYRDYLEKRKSGISKSKANFFESSHVLHENLLPVWSFQDVDDTCRELSRSGLIQCHWADNIAVFISISDIGISYMENRFKNGLKEVGEFLSNFLPF